MTNLHQEIKKQQTAHLKKYGTKMEKENFYFTMQEIADQLGVSPSSIMRWVDSGKLKCAISDGEKKVFSTEHLMEFAMKYNISMAFLDARRSTTAKREATSTNIKSASL